MNIARSCNILLNIGFQDGRMGVVQSDLYGKGALNPAAGLSADNRRNPV